MSAAEHCISVITALHSGNLGYISEAYSSILAQTLDPPWKIKWILQLDGVAPDSLPRNMLDDPTISLGWNRQSGAGVARTNALSRVDTKLVRNLDSDDQLLPGALAQDIAVFESDPRVGWVCSKALDLGTDGTLQEWPGFSPPSGFMPPQTVFRYWMANNWMLPILPGTLCIRLDLLLALGGWMALPASEDTGLLLAADAVAAGFYLDRPSMLYRHHPGQTTARPEIADPEFIQGRYRLVTARAKILAQLHLKQSFSIQPFE